MQEIDPAENLTGWLYRVTVDLCRGQKWREVRTEELEDAVAPAADPHQELTLEERRRILEMSL